MSERSLKTIAALGGGASCMLVGFVFLGQFELAPVLGGGVLFTAGAILSGGGVVRAPRPQRRLLAKACFGFGVAGLALSVLMAAVSPFTGQNSQTLGLVTGAVGGLAGLILIASGVVAQRRSAEPDEGR